MISFYPGPSRVHDAVPSYVKDAYQKGILSINHRSEEFMAISKKTIFLLREKLNVPGNYHVFFTSSATECWEIIAQSLIKSNSYHFYNGAFGEKWYDYTRRLRRQAKSIPFPMDDALDPKKMGNVKKDSVICITQNETSNGTQVALATIRSIKRNNRDCIVSVDATSSMGGITLDFRAADVWYAPVQKCFGLPAGLGILICSPRAIQRAKDIGERQHYNSLLFMTDMMMKWQTSYTTNVLGIYLLQRVLEKSKPIDRVHKKTVERYNQWMTLLSERQGVAPLIKNKAVQSFTVIPVKGSPEITSQLKAESKEKGLFLGEGYGACKLSTFRIANFPALKKKEHKKLMRFLVKF
jgi:phosphoserine aminotransferase